MNKNSRVIRALKAAKKAFEQTPPPAPKTVTEKKPFHSEYKTAPVTAVNVDGLDKSRCTGCSACSNICPVSASVISPCLGSIANGQVPHDLRTEAQDMKDRKSVV